MSTLFISDLHLEDAEPVRTGLFLDLISGPAREAEALYILGDLFEYWIGDDALSETARRVATAISGLNQSGTPCYFIHGNRDFLLGTGYADNAELRLLPETCVIDLYGTPTLILHGDTLCTDDTVYQDARKQMRNPQWQESILAMTVEQRLELARNARDASMQYTSAASMDIMDVNARAVSEAFREHGVTRMIHGHTHRPAFHQHVFEGVEAQRIVLADWYRRGSYLEVTENRAESFDL